METIVKKTRGWLKSWCHLIASGESADKFASPVVKVAYTYTRIPFHSLTPLSYVHCTPHTRSPLHRIHPTLLHYVVQDPGKQPLNL